MLQQNQAKSNQGNSFLVVVATISFLAVMVTALLVAVTVCFRMKAYDINSRDNFYYLEQAMDIIYEKVGENAMKDLNDAYDATSNLLVYYDTDKEAYVTMDNDTATSTMMNLYKNNLRDEVVSGELRNSEIVTTFTDCLRNARFLDDEGDSIYTISVDNVVFDDTDDFGITIKNLVLKREATYSSVNASKNANPAGAERFIQSITTDLVIGKPDFTIDFNTADNSDLYDFVMISDKGIELEGLNSKYNITGNVYAAADFYNKKYDFENPKAGDNPAYFKKVSTYTADQQKSCDGLSEKSMYSGLYVSQAKLSVMADKLIIPGSIAAMNAATITLNSGNSLDTTSNTLALGSSKIWADDIILGGYSRTGAAKTTGASMDLKADAYVSDDLELNAAGSNFALNGSYYGYNYASTDNRTYSQAFLDTSANRAFSGGAKTKDSIGLEGQAHYNSSSVVVNGQEATLDLSKAKKMYIAGQAYVEMSKSTTTTKVTPDATKPEEEAEAYSYNYNNYNYEAAGQPDKNTADDNYTQRYIPGENGNNGTNRINEVEDYRTGEGLSVKSNQLAYIPPYTVHEDGNGNMYVTWPALFKKLIDDQTLYNTIDQKDKDGNTIRDAAGQPIKEDYFTDLWNNLSEVPVIKTVVNGKPYYFYDFSRSNNVKMNEYIAEYARLFDLVADTGRTAGELSDFYDITDQEATQFKINNIEISDQTKIYSNSAISYIKNNKFTVIANQQDADALLDADANITNVPTGTLEVDSANLTTSLRTNYNKMKYMLTASPNIGAGAILPPVPDEGLITPINFWFDDFENLADKVTYPLPNADGTASDELSMKMDSGYWVYRSDDKLEITTTDPAGVVRGIILCNNDVTFDNSVKQFEGLIVTGGKIKANHSMDFIVNQEIVKSILNECDTKMPLTDQANKQPASFCNLFKYYTRKTKADTSNDRVHSMKDISSIQYEDIVAFDKWMKNVD